MVTKVVIALSDFALANWWLILIGAGGGFFGIKLLIRRNEGFSKFWDRLKLDLPVIGPLVSLIVQARFIKNFGIIHRSGIPVIDNLELCSGFVSNKIFTNSILKVRSKVRDGGQLTEAIKDTRLFSSLVVRMIQLGESTGQLDRSLNYAADYYNKELPRQIKKMFAILEPVLILSLVLLVGTVALAIFLPILSISGSVR
jgi:type II secretory pathway component PulF